MMSCEQATRLMSDAQDRELSFRERTSLRMHLLICAGCKNFGVQMKHLRAFARAYIMQKEKADKDPSGHD